MSDISEIKDGEKVAYSIGFEAGRAHDRLLNEQSFLAGVTEGRLALKEAILHGDTTGAFDQEAQEIIREIRQPTSNVPGEKPLTDDIRFILRSGEPCIVSRLVAFVYGGNNRNVRLRDGRIVPGPPKIYGEEIYMWRGWYYCQEITMLCPGVWLPPLIYVVPIEEPVFESENLAKH